MAKFEHEVKIDAPADVVWSVISDPGLWPHWFDAVDRVTTSRDVGSSNTFQWQNGENTGTGVITRMEPNEELAFELVDDDKRTEHVIRLSGGGGLLGRGGGDTRLEYVMSYDVPGGFLGNFIVGGNPFDERRAANVAERIKELAEQRAGGR